jgi:hypothetical protein
VPNKTAGVRAAGLLFRKARIRLRLLAFQVTWSALSGNLVSSGNWSPWQVRATPTWPGLAAIAGQLRDGFQGFPVGIRAEVDGVERPPAWPGRWVIIDRSSMMMAAGPLDVVATVFASVARIQSSPTDNVDGTARTLG